MLQDQEARGAGGARGRQAEARQGGKGPPRSPGPAALHIMAMPAQHASASDRARGGEQGQGLTSQGPSELPAVTQAVRKDMSPDSSTSACAGALVPFCPLQVQPDQAGRGSPFHSVRAAPASPKGQGPLRVTLHYQGTQSPGRGPSPHYWCPLKLPHCPCFCGF
ncbi:hypothetical protein H1C71_021149 [Ictidomys tridecemlineatus]|nr:hypothetical protein H1C71_021149 [Ictidomys tridecemlineatus]KAG3275680.1 hypothetical protein H1C71_021149 [Ictidomys tridecemlineatus]